MGNFRLTDIGILSQVPMATPVLPTISWNLKTGVSAYNLTHVAYGNGIFLVSADRGCGTACYVRKSLDYGANWSDSHTSGTVSTSSVGYVGGYWYHSNRCYETVANVWYSNSLATNNTWTGILSSSGNYNYNTWEAGNYCVNGHYNSYYTYATAGNSWTNRRLETANSQTIQNAGYSARNSLYYIKTSYNNKTYTMTSLAGTGQASCAAISGAQWYTAHGANESLAFVYGSSSATAIKKDTTDGKTFGTNVTTLPTYTAIAGIKHYDGMYIMTYTNTADYTKHVALSFDGESWTESTVPTWNATPFSGNGNIACGLIGSTHYIMIIANNSTSVLIGTYED